MLLLHPTSQIRCQFPHVLFFPFILLKWLVTQKIDKICRVYPINTRLFFWFITCTFKRRVSSYFDLELINLSLFAWKHLKIRQKGSNWSILNLNDRRLGRLKVNIINQKSLVLMEETLQKNLIFEWPVTSNEKCTKNADLNAYSNA